MHKEAIGVIFGTSNPSWMGITGTQGTIWHHPSHAVGEGEVGEMHTHVYTHKHTFAHIRTYTHELEKTHRENTDVSSFQ